MSANLIHRRQFLGGFAASAILLPATRVFAYSNFQVGNVQVTALSDGSLTVPAGFFKGTTDAQQAALGETITLAANTYAYQSGERTFLFDAGSGTEHFISQNFPNIGALPADLAQSGIDANSVTDIVITHMHIDHIGGLVLGGQPVFPNATIHVSAADWDFWMKPGLANSVPDGLKPMVNAAQTVGGIIGDNIKTYAGEANLGAGVALVPTPGHTPGHSGVMLTAGSEQLMLIGDAFVSERVHFANPDAAWALEFAPDIAAQTRKTLLDRFATDKIMIAGSHLSAPGTGFVERDGSAYRFIPSS